MSDLSKIYAPWDGNAAALAADIGEKDVTVRQWRNRGKIDQRYWPKIIAKAAERGAVLTPLDFVPHLVTPDHAAPDTTGDSETSPGKAEDFTAGECAA